MLIVNRKTNKTQGRHSITIRKGNSMNKNKLFSAIVRGFEMSGISALSSVAGSALVNDALQEIIETRR